MPTQTRDFSVDWGISGLVGTLAYQVIDFSGTVLIARTAAGIVESPAGSGQYYVAVANFDTSWSGRIVWDDGIDFVSEGFDALAGGGSVGISGASVDISAESAVIDGSLILSVTIKKGGSLADADAAPALTDQADAYGIKREDSGAVVVAAGTAMAHGSTGQYSFTQGNVAEGVTYDWAAKVIVDGVSYFVTRAAAVPAGGGGDSYLSDLDEANALAAARSGLAAWKGASAADQAAAAQVATERVDAAGPYQGRKYDRLQALEFPRVAYESSTSIATFGGVALVPPDLQIGGTEYYDWDEATKTVIVPQKVLLAVLYEANAILADSAGERADRMQAIADGLIAQAAGSLSEQYAPRSPIANNARAALCLDAQNLLRGYWIRVGRLV